MKKVLIFEDINMDCERCEKVLEAFLRDGYAVEIRDINRLNRHDDFDLSVRTQACMQNNALPVVYLPEVEKFIDTTKEGWFDEL